MIQRKKKKKPNVKKRKKKTPYFGKEETIEGGAKMIRRYVSNF